MTETKQIQNRICELLIQKLVGRDVMVKKEWDVAKDSNDDYSRTIHYSPRVDIAVSPFMINYVTEEEKSKLDAVFNNNLNLIQKIKEKGETFSDFSYNQNPRCLMAIEIETSGTKKHLVGDITNASILGKIGLIVPTNESNYRSFKRIMNYLEFAQKNGKMSSNVFKNIVLIKYQELINLLEESQNDTTN